MTGIPYHELGEFRRWRVKQNVVRAARRRGTPQQQDALADDCVLENVAAEAWARFSERPESEEIGDGRLLDQILRFLQFILDNWDIIGPIFGLQND